MTAAAVDRLRADLTRIGRHPDTGGYRRYALTAGHRLPREWFAGAARVPGSRGCLATIGKTRLAPGGVNAIPSAATRLLDARGADEAAEREDCPAGVEALAAVLAGLVGDHP